MIVTDYIKDSVYEQIKTKLYNKMENNFNQMQLVSPRQGLLYMLYQFKKLV